MKYLFACVVGTMRVVLLSNPMLSSATTREDAERIAHRLIEQLECPIAVLVDNGKFRYEVGVYGRGHFTVS